MKVVHSRDVVFNEPSMPGIQKETGTIVKYVELDNQEESDETSATKLPKLEVLTFHGDILQLLGAILCLIA